MFLEATKNNFCLSLKKFQNEPNYFFVFVFETMNVER